MVVDNLDRISLVDLGLASTMMLLAIAFYTMRMNPLLDDMPVVHDPS